MENKKYYLKKSVLCREEIQNGLDKLEEKIYLLMNFYEELEVLRKKRKENIDNLLKISPSDRRPKRTQLKSRVIFDSESIITEDRPPKVGAPLEYKKSLARVYDMLENLNMWHGKVNQKMSEIQLIKQKKKTIPNLAAHNEFDEMLAKLQTEKDEIDEKMVQFVIKNIYEGKDEFLNAILNLEDENKEMEDKVNLLQNKVEYLKNTNTALMLENKKLKTQRNSSSVVYDDNYRKSILLGKASFSLPESPRSDRTTDIEKFLSTPYIFEGEKEDRYSLEVSRDSFALDAPLATWETDMKSMQEKVKKIGKNLEEMEVNQMKLDLLKRYVRKHGSRYINKHTLIDPSNGMSLWHIQ